MIKKIRFILGFPFAYLAIGLFVIGYCLAWMSDKIEGGNMLAPFPKVKK